jgi:hypothetical protein
MSAITLRDFEREIRTLIRSRHGIAISLTYEQVKGLLKASNLSHGDAFMRKIRDNGMLRPLPAPPVAGHARYGVDAVVRLIVNLNGGSMN